MGSGDGPGLEPLLLLTKEGLLALDLWGVEEVGEGSTWEGTLGVDTLEGAGLPRLKCVQMDSCEVLIEGRMRCDVM